MMLGLPVGVYALSWAAGKPSLRAAILELRPALARMFQGVLPSALQGLALVSGWMGFQALLERLLPGPVVEGSPLPIDPPGKLKYRMNGHRAFWVSLLLAGLFQYKSGGRGLSQIYQLFSSLKHGSVLFSALLSVYLYQRSFQKREGNIIAGAGQSPSPVYNFFMGRELNPRIGTFDLKVFCELRPGLIGWVMINLGMAAQQYRRLGGITLPMALLNLLQGLYVWDALYYEQAILSTMDVTTEGFGYMLAFGDLVWVPFVYSMQSQFLVNNTPACSSRFSLAAAALGMVGYYVFRGSNGQKDLYRRKPELFSDYKTIKTRRGTTLLADGWWKVARKINYTGDILMATSWSLLCGPNPVTYFYPIYLAGLLYHRALRDDAFCSAKHGEDWEEYKRQVPYLMVPGLL